MNEIVREFLLETQENLAQLDQDLITLEKIPGERETLARVFRTLHTVKGTAGFLGLPKLLAIAHAGENLLSRLRAAELTFNPEIATALLGVVDAVRQVLTHLEATAQEGDGDYSELIRMLERLTHASGTTARPRTSPTPPPAVNPIRPTTPVPEPVAVVIGPTRITIPAPTPPPTATPVSVVTTEPAETRAAVSDSSIRVDVGLLDKLMTLVGELVLARNQIVQFGTTQEDTVFLGTVQRLNLLTTELQVGVMKTRMQPVGNVWSKFPRIVRDLAVACGKQVRIDMDGQETELDKTIIEAVRDPLTHIVRNAVDHGIEPPVERAARSKPAEGRLHLHAFHEGGKVVIEITDDGGGIDPLRVREKVINAGLVSSEQVARLSERELIRLVFLPGFSTADRVTQFSGRGVGMDVVRTNIEKIGGTVDIESRVGLGTTVRMKIPLTLAIIPALIVACGGDFFAIPQVSLLELVRLEDEQARKGVEWIHGAPVYRLRGNLLPLVYLDRQLRIVSAARERGEVNIVVLQADDRQFGLVVDRIHDTEEIVIKPLQKQLKGIGTFAGVTIMGDGKVALILDVLGLAQQAGAVAVVRERKLSEKSDASAGSAGDRQTVLLCETRGGGRVAIPLAMVARLEEFPRSAVERAGEQDVIQYRGEILPLTHVSQALRRSRDGNGHDGKARRGHPAERDSTDEDENLHVVVHNVGGRRVGLVVGRILDIVEETIANRFPTSQAGVLFTAVVHDRVTEFLDVEEIVGKG